MTTLIKNITKTVTSSESDEPPQNADIKVVAYSQWSITTRWRHCSHSNKHAWLVFIIIRCGQEWQKHLKPVAGWLPSQYKHKWHINLIAENLWNVKLIQIISTDSNQILKTTSRLRWYLFGVANGTELRPSHLPPVAVIGTVLISDTMIPCHTSFAHS